MRIQRLRTATVEANYDWTFVRLETDGDLAGLGECFFAPGLTRILADLEPVLVGEDPRDLHRLFRKLQRAASGTGSVAGIVYNAISGIEAALWDLAGKALGVPIWQLLGGRFRREVRLYADCHAGEGLESCGPVLQPREPAWYRDAAGPIAGVDPLSPAAHADRAAAAVERGFTALKFDLDAEETAGEERRRLLSQPELNRMIERVAAVRDAIGPAIDLALDCHWRYPLADVTGSPGLASRSISSGWRTRCRHTTPARSRRCVRRPACRSVPGKTSTYATGFAS